MGQGIGTAQYTISLESLSDGELLELAVPSEPPTQSRRVLVLWLYLKDSVKAPLAEFDHALTSLAEKELERRAGR